MHSHSKTLAPCFQEGMCHACLSSSDACLTVVDDTIDGDLLGNQGALIQLIHILHPAGPQMCLRYNRPSLKAPCSSTIADVCTAS